MQVRSFIDQTAERRVVFAAGATAGVGSELAALGWDRVLLVSTGHRAPVDAVTRALGDRCVGVFDRARTQVPAQVAEAATRTAREVGADGLLAVGGGTAIGAAKAVALATSLPIAALPTTYSGSEMTQIWGITRQGQKTTGHDERVRPRLVLYDPELLAALPFPLARTSLFNALAHAAEALYDPAATDDLLDRSERAAGAIVRGLRRLHRDPTDLEASSDALYGAFLAGGALDRASMALHHKLAHVLGGSFGTPHAETHAVLLPHTLAYNLTPEAHTRLGRALGSDDPPAALFDLALQTGIPTRLDALGFTASEIPQATKLALARPYPNPRPLTEEGIARLLRDAVRGNRPNRSAR